MILNQSCLEKISISYLFRRKIKLHFHYDFIESQLLEHACIDTNILRSIDQILLQLLEMYLNNIVFQLDITSTLSQTRQLVNHIYIFFS